MSTFYMLGPNIASVKEKGDKKEQERNKTAMLKYNNIHNELFCFLNLTSFKTHKSNIIYTEVPCL